jgi:hypothetical protein
VTEKPSEVKDDYVSKPVGITAFKQSPAEEVPSPFRKKRGTLGVQLKTINDDDEEDLAMEKMDKAHALLKPLFADVITNYKQRQNEFDQLKKLSSQELAKSKTHDDLFNLRQIWTTGLELRIPQNLEIEPNHLDDFKQKNNIQFKEIENFVNIVSDWLNEAIEE